MVRVIQGLQFSFQIINIFSMDSHRMFMASLSITFIFSVPIFVVGGSVYCHYLIGPWCFVAIGVWIITYLVMVNILKSVN